jgi:iron complex outermembrane receptor protein
MTIRTSCVGVALLIAAAIAAPLPAAPEETGAAYASITGVIADRSGNGIPGATISLTGSATRTVISGERGLFHFDLLPPGSFSLAATLDGFAGATSALDLEPGERRVVELRLEPDRFSYLIDVIGEAPRESLAATAVRENPGREIADALTRIPGMSKVRKGGAASDVVLRGYQGENLNVLVDGVKVYGACPNNMDPPLFHTDLSEVERVEIGKGPFDMKNAGSLGGVVNLVTRQPGPGLFVSPSFTLGSFGFVHPSVTISQSGKNAAIQGGISYRESEPYADGDGNRFTKTANYRPGMEDTDAFRIGSAWLRGDWTLSDAHRFQLALSRQEADHVLYPYLLMDAVYDDTSRLNLSYEYVLEANVLRSLRAQAYTTRVEHWMTDEWRASSSSAPRSYSMGTEAETASTGLEIEADFGRWQTGLDLLHRSWLAKTRMAGMGYAAQAAVPDVDIESAGVYVEGSLPLAAHWTLDTGARIDWAHSSAASDLANTNLYFAYNGTRSTDASDAYPSGKVSAVFRPASGVEFSAAIGSTVRLPDAQERYFGLRRAGSDWVGDPDLAPVRNTGLNLSGRLVRGGLTIEGTLFRDEIDNFIAVHDQARINQVPGVMNTKARSYAATDATMRGAELSAVAALGRGFSIAIDASAVRGSKDAVPEEGIESSYVAEIPPHAARAALRYENDRAFGEAEGVFAARQDRVDTDLGEKETPGYGIANVRAGTRFGWLQLTVAIYNVFDRQYVEHLSYQRDPFRSGARVPEPGRSMAITTSASF